MAMRRLVVWVLFYASSVCWAQGDETAGGRDNAFSAFDNGAGSAGTGENRNEIHVSSGIHETLPVDETLYAVDSYTRIIERLINDPSVREIRVADKVIDARQQKEILDLLGQVRREDQRLATERVSAMCAEWQRDEGALSLQERADRALSMGKELEIRYWSENVYRVSMLSALADITEVADTALLLRSIEEFETRNSRNMRSWSDMVRNAGREVEQFEMMCGGIQ